MIISPADFLNAVTPQGIRYIGFNNENLSSSGNPILNCTPYELDGQGESKGKGLEQRNRNNVYFTLASFKVARVQSDKGYMKSHRTQENVNELKSIWLDIDFKQYTTPQECQADLNKFLNNADISMPTFIVHSGGGFHVYWCFEDPISVKVWTPLAIGLEGLAREHGLKYDAGVTTDSARVLRLPESMNRKHGGAIQCKVKHMGAFADLGDMQELLHDYVGKEAGPDFKVDSNVVDLFGDTNTDDLTGGTYSRNSVSSFAKIIEDCATVRDAIARRGAGDDYPHWKNFLHLAAFTEDGEEYIAALSDGHEKYSEAEANEKFHQSVKTRNDTSKVGPPMCISFRNNPNSKCASCPHKISSPWSLGVEKTEDPTNVPSVSRNGRTFVNKTMPGEDDMPDVIVQRQITNWESHDWDLLDMTDGEFELQFKAGPTKKLVALQTKHMGSFQELSKELMRRKFTLENLFQQKEFFGVAMSWINKLREERVEADDVHVGWSQDKKSFTLADTVYSANGTERKLSISGGATSREYVVVGSDKPMQSVMGVLMVDPDPRIQFSLALSFAGPLMSLGAANSFVVSLHSANSGAGKTTILRAGAAVWGHPGKTFALKDTSNYIVAKSAAARDLPMFYDEMRTKNDREAEEISDLIFQVIQGKSKGRANKDGDAKEVQDLRTMMICGTNNPVKELMASAIRDSNAGMMRFLELNLPIRQDAPNLEFNKAISDLNDNYGHAGVEFIRKLVANVAMADAEIMAEEKRLIKITNSGNPERFWTQAMAKTVVAAKLAKDFGITDFDVDQVRQVAIQLIDDHHQEYQYLIEDNGTVLNKYLTWARSGTLFIRAQNHVEHHPDRSIPLRVRVDLKNKEIVIPKMHFQTYCKDLGRSPSSQETQLKLENPGLAIKKRAPGAGVPTLNVVGQLKCFVIPMTQGYIDDLAIASFEPMEPDTSSPIA